jgi:hypothetical protein
VIVSTDEKVQHILIQLSKTQNKVLSKEIEWRIVKIYPDESKAVCKIAVRRTENICKKATRITKYARAAPSVHGFSHLKSSEWQVCEEVALTENIRLSESDSEVNECGFSVPKCVSNNECDTIIQNGSDKDIEVFLFNEEKKLEEFKSKNVMSQFTLVNHN